jgi:hypothetical protein
MGKILSVTFFLIQLEKEKKKCPWFYNLYKIINLLSNKKLEKRKRKREKYGSPP